MALHYYYYVPVYLVYYCRRLDHAADIYVLPGALDNRVQFDYRIRTVGLYLLTCRLCRARPSKRHSHRCGAQNGKTFWGLVILTETRKPDSTNKRKHNIHSLHSHMKVASCHQLRENLPIVKPRRIDTAAESRGRRRSRVE